MNKDTVKKTVNIPCPKCSSTNHYSPATLEAAGGQVTCTNCKHPFTLIRRTQPATTKANNSPSATHRNTDKTTKEILGKPNRRDTSATLIDKPAAPSGNKKDNTHNRPEDAIEALLQRNQPAPPPANLPTIDKLLQNFSQPNTSGPTQNIHIQAQSLVFNLVSGKENGNNLLRPPIELSDLATDGSSGQNNNTTETQGSEFNWTLASLVALTTLIVQLFYYMLMQS